MGRRWRGNVTKKGDDGRWRGRVMIHGQVYTVSSLISRADCRAKLTRRIAELLDPRRSPAVQAAAAARETPRLPGPATVASLLTDWLKVKKLTLRAESSYTIYQRVVTKQIIPILGPTLLTDLKPSDLLTLYARLEREGASPTAVRRVHSVLRVALNDAIRDGNEAIKPNCARVKAPAVEPPKHPWPTPPEIGRFLSAITIDRDFAVLFEVAAFSGLRQGEVLGLTWPNVDAAGSRIWVGQQLGHDGQKLRDLKAVGQRRWVWLPTRTMQALERHRAEQIDRAARAGTRWSNPDDLVFTTAIGRPLHHEVVRRAYRERLARAGVPMIRFHALRHGMAMAALAAGTDLRVIQDRLGHANFSTTSEHYLHADEQLDRDLAERLAQVIAPT